MQEIYPYFLIVHLICAIIFLGFIFTDVVLLSILRKNLGEEALMPMMKRGVKIMPFCLLLLVITGGAMVSSYINFNIGFFESNLQKFLTIKVILVLAIVALVINSFFFKLVLKKPNPLKNLTHPFALIFGFAAVIFAKMAFYF